MRFRRYAEGPNPRDGDRHVESASAIDAGGGPDEKIDDERYRLISIDAVRAPEGCAGRDWHVYRITQGKNGITGYRRGDLAGVRADVEAIVTALNGRRQWTKSNETSRSRRRAATAARRVAAK
jgi:hypothetical protein